MQVAVRGKNMQITDSLKRYAEKRVGKLKKYFDIPQSAQVLMAVEKDRHIVEVTVPLDDMLLRGEEETGDMYSSIDLVVEKLEKQVEKFKTRIARRIKQNDNRQPLLAAGINVPEEDLRAEGKPSIVKIKRFPIKPMDPEEAVMQMNLVGHDFFVFTNARTERVNVVYRRKDGDYGLIEPEP